MMKEDFKAMDADELRESIDLHKLIYGMNLKQYRINAQLSQRGLSAVSGVTQTMISLIENGRVNLSINTMTRLASSVEVPLWRFFDHEALVDDVQRVDLRG